MSHNDTTPPPLRLAYRIPEVAQMLGISRAKGYELAAQGVIPTIHIGTLRRVPADALRGTLLRLAEQANTRREDELSAQNPRGHGLPPRS